MTMTLKDCFVSLKDHPASTFCLEIAVDLPRALGEVAGMNEVDSGPGGALRGLDVVAGQAYVEGFGEVVRLPGLLPRGLVQWNICVLAVAEIEAGQ